VPDRAHPMGAQAGPPEVFLDPLGRVPACDFPDAHSSDCSPAFPVISPADLHDHLSFL